MKLAEGDHFTECNKCGHECPIALRLTAGDSKGENAVVEMSFECHNCGNSVDTHFIGKEARKFLA